MNTVYKNILIISLMSTSCVFGFRGRTLPNVNNQQNRNIQFAQANAAANQQFNAENQVQNQPMMPNQNPVRIAAEDVNFRNNFDRLVNSHTEDDQRRINRILTGKEVNLYVNGQPNSIGSDDYVHAVLSLYNVDPIKVGFIISEMLASNNAMHRNFAIEASNAISAQIREAEPYILDAINHSIAFIDDTQGTRPLFRRWLRYLVGFEALQVNNFGNVTISGLYNTNNTRNFEASHNWVQKTFPNVRRSGATGDQYYLDNPAMGFSAKAIYNVLHTNPEYCLFRNASLYHKGRLLGAYFRHNLNGGITVDNEGNFQVRTGYFTGHNQLRLTRILLDLHASCPWACELLRSYMAENRVIDLRYFNDSRLNWL